MLVCEREQLMGAHGLQVGIALAAALAQQGQHGEAARLAEDMIAGLRENGASAVMFGVAYETRARIALAMDDSEAFERFAELCGHEFNRGRNPVLAARFARLLEEARSATGGSIVPGPHLEALTSDYSDGEYSTIYSRIEECGDGADRARCALTIMLQHLESFAGYLYGVNADGPTLLAGLPNSESDAELESWLASWLAAEFGGSAPPSDRYRDRDGRRFAAVPLFGGDERETRLAGVLVTHVQDVEPRSRIRELSSRIAAQLLEHGDVEGIALHDEQTQTVD
jgi:hypothetical protein